MRQRRLQKPSLFFHLITSVLCYESVLMGYIPFFDNLNVIRELFLNYIFNNIYGEFLDKM